MVNGTLAMRAPGRPTAPSSGGLSGRGLTVYGWQHALLYVASALIENCRQGVVSSLDKGEELATYRLCFRSPPRSPLTRQGQSLSDFRNVQPHIPPPDG